MKVVLNSRYGKLGKFVNSLPVGFKESDGGVVLHDGRNTIKMYTVDGVKVVVKSYGRLSLTNRLIYGILRKSKAMRAYIYAIKLRSLGIDTPEQVAVVEGRRRGLLAYSYFVSAYTDYLPMSEVTDNFTDQPDIMRPILDAFAEFLLCMHRAGVLHGDLNITNILYHADDCGGYKFQIIDTNRMKFRRSLSMRDRIENMRRLACKVTAFAYILERYGTLAETNIDSFEMRGIAARLFFEMRQYMKHKLKRRIKIKF